MWGAKDSEEDPVFSDFLQDSLTVPVHPLC